jgi:hypothetical protein
VGNEKAIFDTDEIWMWAVNEFKHYLPGKRYPVAVCATGDYGLLIENGSEVRFFVGGIEYAPNDKIRNVEPLVMLPRRVKDFYAAKRWNDKVRAARALDTEKQDS